jgi:hypothetical protein
MVTQLTLTILALLDWRMVWERGDSPSRENEHNTSIPVVDLESLVQSRQWYFPGRTIFIKPCTNCAPKSLIANSVCY